MTMPYAVGNKVKLLVDIWDDGCENHHPPSCIARKGEVLVVRRNKMTLNDKPWLAVSHEHITDKSFAVSVDEIEPA